jgi:hypothetical protein
MDGHAVRQFSEVTLIVQEDETMRYALLIYGNERAASEQTPEEQAAVMAAHNAFGDRYRDKILGGEALLTTDSATTVRVRNGKALTTDGPFAETKEQLGGFYLVKCENLDEALQIAADLPGVEHGSIEVRPLMDFE